MKMNLNVADELLSRIEQLLDDLNSKNMSSYGKEVLIEQLNKCFTAYRESFKNIICMASSLESEYKFLESKYKSLEEMITQPQKRENDFKDIAKKFNFYSSPATLDGSFKNPNDKMPFEDLVPKKDIKFMKEYIPQDKEYSKDNVVPKEERLTKKRLLLIQVSTKHSLKTIRLRRSF